MHVFKCLIWLYAMVFLGHTLCAQEDSLTRRATTLFDDLPIDDAALRSVLLPHEIARQKIEENIYVRTVVNKRVCYAGEPLLVSYELYTCLQSTSMLLSQPVLPGLIAHSMQVNNEEVRYKKHNGKQCRLYRMLQYQAIPYQEGEIFIEPVSVQNTVSYTDADGTKKEYKGSVTGEEVKINVNAMPSENKPPLYSGAVGTFNISSPVYTFKCGAGEQHTLTIIIEGAGSFDDIELPAISWPIGVEHFTPKDRSEIDYNVFPASGRKVFEIPFVCKNADSFYMPAIAFSFFDPVQKQYKTVQTQPIAIVVKPDEIAPKQIPSGNERLTPFFYFLSVLLICGVIALIIFLKRSKQTMAEQNTKSDDTHLKEIDILEAIALIEYTYTGREGIKQVKQLLLSYLNDRTENTNALKTVQASTGLQQLIDECNLLLYAPAVADDTVCKNFIKECSSWLSRMTMHPA